MRQRPRRSPGRPSLREHRKAVPDRAVTPPTATVPGEPKSCIDIFPNTAVPAPFRSNFADPLVVDIEVNSSEQENRYVPAASESAPLVDQLNSFCTDVALVSG